MSPAKLSAIAAVAALVLTPTNASAHGSHVAASLTRQVDVRTEVEIEATDHAGSPMSEAQVNVFAPGNTASPWLVGSCDEDGRFVFEPPHDLPGTWEVQVLHHGHGGRVSFEIAPPVEGREELENTPASVRIESSSQPHTTLLQRVVMVGCVVWGLVGTALFFLRRSR